MWTHQDSILN